MATPCGPIEYQEAGTGVPLLAVHGTGSGYDQGMAFAGHLVQQGIWVIAMSRLLICARPDDHIFLGMQASELTVVRPFALGGQIIK